MTSTETRPTWSERWNPRNWTLAWKLVAVGVVPALLALVLGVLRVSDQAGAAADLGRSSRLLEVRGQVAAVADALRQERDDSTVYVAAGRSGDRALLDIGYSQSDAQVATMLAAVRSTEQLDASTARAREQAETKIRDLKSLRVEVANSDAANPSNQSASQVSGLYTGIVDTVDTLDRSLLRQLRAPGTSGLADALTATTAASEQLALQHTVLGAAIRAGKLGQGDTQVVTATENQLDAAVQEYRVALTPEQITRTGDLLPNQVQATTRESLRTSIVSTPPNQQISVSAGEWDAAYQGSRSAVETASTQVRQELVATSTAAEQRASNLAGINSVVLMLGLLIGITIAVLISRALIRALRVLRTSALDVAERRLPQAVESMRAGETPDVTIDPVPLTSRDEVGQVARAFDAVHGQAVRLAAEQAALQSNVSAMFVNLSRRSQALVERQLQLIEQLESNEQDSDQLSNLFQLDHLATRMRRNSENLLVLAGTDLSKRNSAPVPLVDVLRAAVSEVEQYQRIVVQTPPTATLVGRAASDIVHLLAELLDNATNFSPPDSQVVMSTTRTADGSMVVEIADRGVGMADHELSDANTRLSGPSTVDVSASRRMGLFVVGRLGTRHGINVRLSTSQGGGPAAGLTASVTVPAYLVPTSEPSDTSRQAPARTSAPVGLLQQRTSSNGNGRSGSLSALVAGTDGPANPAGVFDASGGDGSPLFSSQQPTNGTPPALPSRRPGSTLRPDGPPLPPGQDPFRSDFGRPDPGEQAEADQRAAEQRARDVADQARRDQEAAERASQERAAQERAAQERATQERAAQERAAQEQAAQRAAREQREAQERETQARAERARVAEERAAAERAAQERAAQEQAAHEQAAREQAEQQSAQQQAPAWQEPAPRQLQPVDFSAPEFTAPDVDDPAEANWTGNAGKSDEAAHGTGLSVRPFAPPVSEPSIGNGKVHTNGTAAGPREDVQETAADEPSPDVTDTVRVEAVTPSVTTDAAEAPAVDEPAAPAEDAEAQEPVTEMRPVVESATEAIPTTPPLAAAEATTAAPAEADAEPQAEAPTTAQAPAPAPSVPSVLPRPRPAFPQRPRPTPTPTSGEATDKAVPQVPPSPPTMPMPVIGQLDSGLPKRTPSGSAAASAATPVAEPEKPQLTPRPQPVARPTPAPAPAAPPAQKPDELFAPSVPVIAEPSLAAANGFELGETTPIFEEIASAWFRSNRPVPVNWETDDQAPAPARAARPSPSPTPVARPTATPTPAPRPSPSPSPAPAPAPAASAAPVAAADQTSGFASVADEGWRVASGMEQERAEELTAAGLPKRRPRARLVPGSAGSAVLAPPVTSVRSAETIRGRLASYQQGVRQGRESRMRGDSDVDAADAGTKPATAGGHDEELS